MAKAKLKLTVTVIAAMILAAGSSPALAGQQTNTDQAVQSAQQTPAELQQLVAPFALYPDNLVAQILAASTYPTQIVEAERWLQKHSSLQGEKLAKEVDKESWDPSVKALTQFPSVLARMNDNLAWTSAVGDAYFNQPQDVLNAVQVMRKEAKDAGTLQSTAQQTVSTQGSTIIIEPANPDVCYLPIYDPWTVYGTPLAVYPGYISGPWVGPAFYFGPAIDLGFFGGFGWGWGFWGCDWGLREVIFDHRVFVSRSPSFFHHRRGEFGRGPGAPFPRGDHHEGDFDHRRGDGFPNRDSGRGRGEDHHDRNFDHDRDGLPSTPNNDRDRRAHRGFEGSAPGTRSGAFSGFGQGGSERGSASRGQSSVGRGGFAGGGMRGGGGMPGGGGMRGGGMRGGGGGRHR